MVLYIYLAAHVHQLLGVEVVLVGLPLLAAHYRRCLFFTPLSTQPGEHFERLGSQDSTLST